MSAASGFFGAGGSSAEVTESVSGGQLLVGITAPFTETVTCPAGKRIKLTLLSVVSLTASYASFTLKSGTRTLYTGSLGPGRGNAYGDGGLTVGLLGIDAASGIQTPYIQGDVDEDIELVFGVSGGDNVAYAYEVLK